MNRIATTTIIRGNGACEIYMNGIVKEEIRKINEQHAMEMRTKDAELQAARAHRNKLLADNLEAARARNCHRKTVFSRIRKLCLVAWAIVWYSVWSVSEAIQAKVK